MKNEYIPLGDQRRSEADTKDPAAEGMPVSFESLVDNESAWRNLFQEDFFTTHEVGTVPEVHNPDHRKDEQETKALRALLTSISTLASDADFIEMMNTMRHLLPSVFEEMKFLQQTPPHDEYDPTEHTFNAIAKLNTVGLSLEDAFVARVALLFHDVGKVIDPLSREHPKRSADMTEHSLELTGLEASIQERILHHIRWHDLLGDATRRDGFNVFDGSDVVEIFSTHRELEVHWRIVQADVGSIPGLCHYVRDIKKMYNYLRKKILERERCPWVDAYERTGKPALLALEGRARCLELHKRLFKPVSFDSIDIHQNMQSRRDRFDALDPEDQDIMLRSLVEFSETLHPEMLSSLQLTGRETDQQFVTALEKKFKRPLESLHVAAALFEMTYALWQSNHKINEHYSRINAQEEHSDDSTEPPNDQILDSITELLGRVFRSAKILERYTVQATHATSSFDAQQIVESGHIKASAPGGHYEGAGVYMGIFNGFRNWGRLNLNDPNTLFEFQMPLRDGLPIIVGFNEPEAMLNVLSEKVLVRTGPRYASARGVKQWHQKEHEGRYAHWKIDLLASTLKANVNVYTMQGGGNVCVVETYEPPIVWAALARALQIGRLMPMSEIWKVRLSESEDLLADYIAGGDLFQGPVFDPNDRLVALARNALIIKGFDSLVLR